MRTVSIFSSRSPRRSAIPGRGWPTFLLCMIVSLGSPDRTTGQTSARASPHSDTPTDEQVAGAVLAAASANIALAGLALERSRDSRVRKLAAELTVASTGFTKATIETARDLDLTPTENLVSLGVTARVERTLRGLPSASEGEFDRRYLLAVEVHQRELLEIIDGLLLPAARDGRLEAILERFRSSTASQLDRGRGLAPQVP